MTAINTSAPDMVSSGTDNLIPVFTADIGGEARPAVDARELHKFLGVKRDFSTWFKKRIAEYSFVENKDYLQLIDSKPPQNGGVLKTTTYVGDKISYHLSLNAVKELAMVERNERGREARLYFIDCEHRLIEQLQSQAQAQASQTPPELPPQSAPETGNDYLKSAEMVSIELLIQERSLFLTLLDCGALGDPAQSAAELQARWRLSRSYFYNLSSDMYAEMYEAVEPNQGELREKTRAAFQFIRQWRPHPGYSFPELSKRRD